MTASQLLAYISVALLLQAVMGVVLAMWRRTAPAGAPQAAEHEDVVTAVKGAWSGWRDFRVVRREFEDAAQTQCSFHLQAVDGVPLPTFQPGQYLTFSLKLPEGVAGTPAGVRTITRCYSLSDRPEAAGYRITIKRALVQLSPGPSARG